MEFEGEHGVIRHFLMDCEVKSRTGHTLRKYRHDLGVLSGLLRDVCKVTQMEQVTVLHLRQCVQYLLTQPVKHVGGRRTDKETLSVNSVRGYVRVWKVFFNWCYQEELISSNPVDRLKLPKPEKKVKPTLEPAHMERMLAACDMTTPMGFRDYVFLLLLFDTGIRLNEIRMLKLVDVHDGYIKVFGKGRKEREIGIHPEVSKLVWKYIHKFRHPKDPNDPYLFIGVCRGHGPLARTSVNFFLKRIQRASGLEHVKISPHVFRHTFAKLYLSRGGDLFKLSRELGHSDVAVTKIYLEDFGSVEARRDHTAFSPIESIQLRKMRGGKKRRGSTNF